MKILSLNFMNEFSKYRLNNILYLFFLFYPISLVLGPALIEITIFFSILIFIYIFSKNKLLFDYNLINIKYFLLLLFIFFCIISSLISDNVLHSLKSSFFSIRFLLYFVIILFLINRSQNYNKIFFQFNFLFLIFCLIDAYVQLILGKNIFFYETSSEIVTGLFFEEKKLGRYLASISPILVGIYLFLGNKNINLKLIHSIIFLNFVFFIILFTSERVSMFYSSLTILITIFYGAKISKKYLILILLPCFILFASYSLKINSFNETVNNSINQIFDNNDSFSYPSKQHRAFIFTSYKLFKEKPFIGVGPNNYRYKCKEITFLISNNCSTHPHNIFFQILGETGIIGAIIYIYFLFTILQKILLFTFSNKDFNPSIFFLLPVLYFFNPFFPSGNFFNNWYMAIGTLGTPFYIYFNEIKISQN